ncbi:MAG TPA: molybdenum cofactor biosynthesis protein MoaE [Bauldia sp.]|nr:molybdenum cofactor biosynthesis protein MoaE [Bauldia sp.]
MPDRITVRVQSGRFDLGEEMARLRQFAGVGAVVTFTGVCRDEGGRLAALELEHYPGMAESEIARIATEAATRWPLIAVTVIHRIGKIAVGDDIVLVATASSHRDAAFAAAGFVMDFLKTSAPFWKKEHPAEGKPGEWVEAHIDDDRAARKWR